MEANRRSPGRGERYGYRSLSPLQGSFTCKLLTGVRSAHAWLFSGAPFGGLGSESRINIEFGDSLQAVSKALIIEMDGYKEHSLQASWIPRTQRLLRRWVPVAAILCFLAWSVVSVRSNFAWDDSEPEVLNLAWRLANGQSIYHGIAAPPFAFAPYPPVFIALTAALLKFTGLSFFPAKLLSFLAALAIGWAMIRLSREWNHTAQGGLWAAFFLFLIPAFLYNSTRCQIQMVAIALSIWSFIFFLRNRWQDTLIVSPLLTILAIYTKQTQIALPIAMIAYLAFRNRRWLFPYISILAVGGLIPFLWLQKITQGSFYTNIVPLAKLGYSAWDIAPVFISHAGPMLIFIGIAISLLWRRFRNGIWEPIDCYLACVFLITLVTLGRVGAHGQYVLEFLVVTLLFLVRTGNLPEIPGRTVLVSIQILILFIYAPLFVVLEEGWWDMAANRAATQIYPWIQTKPGPVLSQQNSFPLFGRGGIYIQLFHFAALSRAGLWDQNRFLSDIDKRIFGCIITEFPIEEHAQSNNAEERFTPEMLKAIQKNYRREKAIYPYYLYTRAK
jgi:hypothetical protein